MNAPEKVIHPSPPKIFKAIRGGFDSIANQIYIILIPFILDLWLWLGPHLQIKNLMATILSSIPSSSGLQSTTVDTLAQIDIGQIEPYLERINLMTVLRSYPVGIPSLVTSILPLEIPIGSPLFVDISSPWFAILLWLIFTLVGTIAGTLYFMVIAQVALNGRVRWKEAISALPHAAMQMIGLTISVAFLGIILLVPAVCILSFMMTSGIPVSQIGAFVIFGMLLWILFPLSFTPLGIVASRLNFITAVQRSALLTRINLPATVLFFGTVIIASQGLDVLWRVPEENSWLTLVGLAGHAFVASSLLAAAFVYYRDADAWAQQVAQGLRGSNV